MSLGEPEAVFYFDTVSPFAYLAWKALRREPLGIPVKPVPVVFGALLKHWKQLGPAEIPPKRVHTYRYCQWLADKDAISLTFPPAHPFLSLPSLRLIVALGGTTTAIDNIFDRIFKEGRDLSSPDEIAAACTALGIPDMRDISTEPVKAALRSGQSCSGATTPSGWHGTS
jgi:2-hydroxychromene-2-carboxylate isomerase